MGADFGEVAFAAVAPVGTPLILVSQSVASPFSLYGGQQVRRNPRSVQDGRFTVLRAGGAKSEHELPAFEALLEATRRVQAGGPVPDPSELR